MDEPSSSRESGFELESAPPATPQVGEIIGNKYALVRLLGEGGMGLVFEALHLRLEQRVALKFLRPDVLVLAEAVERFEREARAASRIRGPHVAHVLDVDNDVAGRPYLVLELLEGRDLEVELQERGSFPIDEAVDYVLQACAAVAEAHRAGVVHRDLKPSNLFLTLESGVRVVKVLDFGISKVLSESADPVTSTSAAVGTPLYMSPEQVRSSKDVDGRADVWSLGVILFELLAGTPPFLGTTTAAIAAIVADATPSIRASRPDVPEALEHVILTALAKDPSQRFPSIDAFAAALIPFASAEAVSGPFSFRPSLEAFEVASSALAHAPELAKRVSDCSQLVGVPSVRFATTRCVRRQTPLRTFAGTMTIGIAVAVGVMMVTPRSEPDARAGVHAAGAHAPPPAAPSSSTAIVHLDGLDARASVLPTPDARLLRPSVPTIAPPPGARIGPSTAPGRPPASQPNRAPTEPPHGNPDHPLYL
jgi:serine/threonine-protein kinase